MLVEAVNELYLHFISGCVETRENPLVFSEEEHIQIPRTAVPGKTF